MHHATSTSDRLTRSLGGYVAGVCEGLGARFGISPTIVRLVWVGLVFFGGTGILFYLMLWWILPREDELPVEPTIWRRTTSGQHNVPLKRTAVDRKLFGVCGGLARTWQVDPSLVRLAVLSLATLSFGLVAVAYLVAAAVMPSASSGPKRAVHPVEF